MISRILESSGTTRDRKRLLAKPMLHWKYGKSTMMAKVTWESASRTDELALTRTDFGPWITRIRAKVDEDFDPLVVKKRG